MRQEGTGPSLRSSNCVHVRVGLCVGEHLYTFKVERLPTSTVSQNLLQSLKYSCISLLSPKLLLG